MASFPDASVNPELNSLGTIQGSDFGGHAPLVGAHVYVLQPAVHTAAGNNSNTNYTAQSNAYGYQASSLLTSSYTAGSAFPTTQNSTDPGIPTSWYYETTDSTGSFNISGDYTCTVGLPVYLYLYGGSPKFPSASNTFNISSASITGSGSSYVVTFTTTTTENAYVGEAVTFSGFTGGLAALNGSGQAVIAANLTTNTFSIATTSGAAGTYTQSTPYPTATFSPTFNPAVVNLAVLGNCPSTGNFTYNFANPSLTPNGLKYVYVNEVATVAAAYAFRPFTLTASTGNGDPDGLSGGNRAIYIGTTSTNLVGIQNAALIAGELYDVQGGNVSTTYAGEGHIARSVTPNGNGIVPQANINELGNILAACVDSNNTATTLGSGGTQGTNMSTQCSTLFNYATNTGIPVSASSGGGTQPYDIAEAAINIARHPGGPAYSYSSTGSSSFVSALYNLPTGNVPFAPYLTTQPNDFTIAIDYPYGSSTNPYSPAPESLAIDKIGNVWVTSQTGSGSNYYFYEFSPTGVASNVQSETSYIYGYVTIDSGESAWSGPAFTNNSISYVHNTNSTSTSGTPTLGSAPVSYTYDAAASNATLPGYFHYASASDSSGDVYFGDEKTQNSGTLYVATLPGAATAPTVTATQSSTALPSVNSAAGGLSHGAMDATGDIYFDYNASNNTGTPTVERVVASTGVNASGWPVTNSTTGCTSMLDPESMAVTRSGDVIVADYHNQTGTVNNASSSLYYITSAGVCTQLSGATLEAGLNSPFGAVIDGFDFFYTTNRGGNSISVFDSSGGSAASTVAVSPSNGYEPQYYPSGSTTLSPMLANPLNIATGPSGETWITDFGNGSLVEIIGLAYPTTTPLSKAAIPLSYTQGSIGYKP